MKRTVLSIALLTSIATTSYAGGGRCELSRDVLAPYVSSSLSTTEYSEVRGRVQQFMDTCPAGPASRESRATFFSFVEREFTTSYSPVLRHDYRTDEREEAFVEAVMQFQGRLERYLETIVSPADVSYKNAFLLAANGRTLAAFGPLLKDEVIMLAMNPKGMRKVTGAGLPHYPQSAAFEALGLWSDPEDHRFSRKEKEEFAAMLRGALNAAKDEGQDGMQQTLIRAVVNGVGHSDEKASERTLEAFAKRIKYRGGSTAKKTDEALRNVRKRLASAGR